LTEVEVELKQKESGLLFLRVLNHYLYAIVEKMKSKIHIYVFIFLQQLLHYCAGQTNELKFTLVEGENGKPLGKITAVTQDTHGYMWFCGQDGKCLYRYDGNRIISFRHDESNPNSLGMTSLETIYADDSGMIWIGGDGLDEFNPATGIFKHFHHIKSDSSSLNGGVNAILKDRRGRLWVGTHGLDCLDEKTGKFVHYVNEAGNTKSLSSNVVRSIYEDHKGVIWIGTGFPGFSSDESKQEGGLNRLNSDGTFTRYLHDPSNPHSLINNQVKAIFEDSRGIFWVGTAGDGLHTMDREKGTFERHTYDPLKPEQLSRPPYKKGFDHITFIQEDVVGDIWIGTYAAGINRYNPVTKKIAHYESGNGFPDSSSWNGFISHDGVLWVATEDSKLLFRVDPFHQSIRHISTGNAGANDFLEDKKGYLWVASEGNGLLKYDQHRNLIKQFKNDPTSSISLGDDRVLSLFQNQEDSIWIGTVSGIRILNTVTGQFSTISNLYVKDSLFNGVPVIYQDKLGFKWFSRWQEGLFAYNTRDNSFKHFFSIPGDSASLSSDRILSILEDRSGVLWIAVMDGGIDRLNREAGSFKHYIPGFHALNLYEDSGGSLWAGTGNGLFRYDQKEDRFISFFDSLSEINSLPIGGIIEDSAKNLWLKSESAVIKLNPFTKETFIYGSKFGIDLNSMPHAAGVHKNRQGELYIGYDKGFYTFYPEELTVKTNFKIIITDFFINTLRVLSGKSSPLQESIEEVSDLDLKYNQDNIAFNFSSVDYRNPEATQYFTMLEGYDNTWRKAVGIKGAYYFNVSPGDYTFRIEAFNSDGTKAEKAIRIHINPPWWKTWWAYFIYTLLFLAVIFAVYSYQKQRIIHRERQKRQLFELAQAKEIEKAYHELRATQAQLIQSEKMASLGELTAGIAHEIQNPLNFVNNFSEVNKELIDEALQANETGNTNEVKELLSNLMDNEEKINHHGKRADAIVKNMLQHSRSSAGQKEPTDINALADEYLRLSYHGLRAKDKSLNATMQTDLDESIGNINIIPQDIGRVLLNLYNNAFYAVAEKQKSAFAKVTADKFAGGYEPVVFLGTKKKNDKVEIRVRDNGNGIPQKVLDKIFQPFFTTKPSGQGTGLGLSLSYDIIKAHGGEIKVETKEGEGTEFCIVLPG
jgi:signal transduction histidine kinase/ligand-binding sensor domain-containing protein